MPKISEVENLKISVVVQKAVIEVSEEGTEAAAATGVGMVRATTADRERPFFFKADRPFAFYVQDQTSGMVLFSGALKKP